MPFASSTNSDHFLILVMLFIVSVTAIFLIVMMIRQGRSGAGSTDSDLLARLYVLVEREGEQQRNRLADTERALLGRVEQLRAELMERVAHLSGSLGKEQAEARAAQSEALREMAETSARQLAAIRGAVTEQLHAAVEQQMQTSFQRVLEQFSEMQKAMGEVSAMTAQIGDLKRLFSNVKTRGGWGEAQLRAILEDVLPPGTFEANRQIGNKREVVEFAVKMPVRGSYPPVLAIDSKFPTEAYERLLDACAQNDKNAERQARRSLETVLKMEARKIAGKYISPPETVEFAVLYLPTDGLYAEVARTPGLIDEIGRTCRVLIMGPSLMPALLRTIHLGYVTLSLEERTDTIARLLGTTRHEMLKMDGVLEKLSRNAQAMSSSIEEARRRTRVVSRQLRDLDVADDESEQEVIAPL
ncbi:DNA recombination protein RmuC [Acetobacter sp.]|uniref:DNA recombination protein RmuC n=1 Tax=Acetobacter sp. TaxID=440 RepID=UPI0039E8398B